MTGSDWSRPVLGSGLRVRERLSAFRGSACAPGEQRAGRCSAVTDEENSFRSGKATILSQYQILGGRRPPKWSPPENSRRCLLQRPFSLLPKPLVSFSSCRLPEGGSRQTPATPVHSEATVPATPTCPVHPVGQVGLVSQPCLPGRGRGGRSRVSGGSNTVRGL